MLEHIRPSSLLAEAAPLGGRAKLRLGERPSWIFKGRGSVMRFQPMLARLAQQSGLQGEADSLEYFLSMPDALKKTPWLVLLGRRGSDSWNETTGAGLEAAGLLFEYRTACAGHACS